MSRRKAFAIRKPCGRIARSDSASSELMPPTELRRLLDAAKVGLRDSAWATEIGRLHLVGKVSATQFAAAKKWEQIVSNYSVACQSPRAPITKSLDPHGGQPADPDSEAGTREVRRHERATVAYLDGLNALRLAGSAAEHAIESICIRDSAPVGLAELNALRTGLQSLASHWSARRKATAQR